jgi:HSP20 family protein
MVVAKPRAAPGASPAMTRNPETSTMRNLIPLKTKNGNARGTGASLTSARDLTDVLNRFFGDPWGTGMGGPSRLPDSVCLDIDETPEEIIVRAEIPGVDPKDVELDLQGDVLTIAGEKKDETSRATAGLNYTERSFGAFRRQIGLPYPIEADKVRAECVNGVLSIHLPKAEAARPRRIEIKAT